MTEFAQDIDKIRPACYNVIKMICGMRMLDCGGLANMKFAKRDEARVRLALVWRCWPASPPWPLREGRKLLLHRNRVNLRSGPSSGYAAWPS